MEHKKNLSSIVIILTLLFTFTGCFAEQSRLALTVYNDNFAVVRDDRTLDFDIGINEVEFTGVASAIEPASVNFKCLSGQGQISILEQNYEYDLVDTSSLLKRYLEKQITVTVKGAGADTGVRIEGKLWASRNGNLVLNRKDGIVILSRDNIERITLTEMPEDLVTEPTLVWLVNSKSQGEKDCRITYTTGAIGWKADYSAVLSGDETNLDFSGWVTIDNHSGTAYENANVKLVAGDVRRLQRPVRRKEMVMALDSAKGMGGGFEEKSFMDYHLYTLGRKTTVKNNQVKQIEFIEPVSGIQLDKIYLYERQKIDDKIQVKMEFKNTEENGLGIALPKGKVRVFKEDPADENLEFVGEDIIDHTPKKEKLSLYIGNAFDIVPEYTLLENKSGRRWRLQTHQVELKNRKDQPVCVFVDESFSANRTWKIENTTHEYEKLSANKIRFKVDVPKDSTIEIEYTVHQSW